MLKANEGRAAIRFGAVSLAFSGPRGRGGSNLSDPPGYTGEPRRCDSVNLAPPFCGRPD